MVANDDIDVAPFPTTPPPFAFCWREKWSVSGTPHCYFCLTLCFPSPPESKGGGRAISLLLPPVQLQQRRGGAGACMPLTRVVLCVGCSHRTTRKSWPAFITH